MPDDAGLGPRLGVSSTFQFNVWQYDLITLKRLTVFLVGFEAHSADI